MSMEKKKNIQMVGKKDYETEKKRHICRGEEIKTTLYLEKRYRHQLY